MITAIYIRKSREDKDKPSHRLTVQREQLPAHAAAQGWQYEIYDDGHASAARGKTEDLKERARLETDIRAGKVNRILCIELSRLSRDDSLQDYVAWLHLCAEKGVQLATQTRSLNPAQHSDWMLLLMEGGFSSVEMKVLKARMKEGADQAYKTGKYMGGTPPPPYTYDHAAGRPVIDPQQLPRMQKLWKLAETCSAKNIAEALEMPEIAVRRALSDSRLEFYQAKRIGTDGENIQCDWEPCIDAEQAARIRAGRKSRKNGQGVRALYGALLSNLSLIYCGYCGRLVKTWYNSKTKLDGTKTNYYGCQSSNTKRKCETSRLITVNQLNEKVLTNIFNTLANLEQLQHYWEYQQEQEDPHKKLEQLVQQEKQQQTKKQRLVAAISEGVIDFADAKIKMTEITDSIELLKARQRDLLQALATSPDWESLIIDREEFEALETDQQRQIISLVIEKIIIYRTHAVITYRFPRNKNGDKTAQINLPTKK